MRNSEVVIISDVHLGTYGCHAKELISYLKIIKPRLLILNGDIIDGWAFSKRYFPASHMEVINEFFRLLKEGTKIVYITGNHDEFLRRYSDTQMGEIWLTDKLLFELDGKKHWVFHGDVFDNTTKGYAKFMAKLGGKGYDLLILLNRAINYTFSLFGKSKISLSKRVKNSVKEAIKFIADFEQTAAELAIENKYDIVICGHIHQPVDKMIETEKGSVRYLNSGDWIENLTALEYHNGEWGLYKFDEKNYKEPVISKEDIGINIDELIRPSQIAAFLGKKNNLPI
ncbi:UDP-2,3-diacylglucosamine diphosphatase [Elizabethkingia anophelis]|uniref:UDP-2,3-diacylglucosamine diphosphatase n=1 Tax=Elizabethkingia anophelis TaxID=1117645 RepID=UPI00378704FC